MQHWLATGLLIFSVAAVAEPAMVADQGQLGHVVLTAERHDGCPGGQRIAYLTRRIDPDAVNDRITYWGCWKVVSAVIQVHYFIGANRSYRRIDFSYGEVERTRIPNGRPPEQQGLPTL
jgi:hypothetical protein